jgi:hypothetical protein
VCYAALCCVWCCGAVRTSKRKRLQLYGVGLDELYGGVYSQDVLCVMRHCAVFCVVVLLVVRNSRVDFVAALKLLRSCPA